MSSVVSLRLPPGPLGVKLGERDPDGSGYACAVVRFNAVRGAQAARCARTSTIRTSFFAAAL